MAEGRPAGYLQAQPRSWTRGCQATTPASGQNGAWTRDHGILSPAPNHSTTLPPITSFWFAY